MAFGRYKNLPDGCEVVRRADDGATVYRYKDREFTVEHYRGKGRAWFCFSGFKAINGLTYSHDSGWSSTNHNKVVHRVCKAVDSDIEEERIKAQLEGREPDFSPGSEHDRWVARLAESRERRRQREGLPQS